MITAKSLKPPSREQYLFFKHSHARVNIAHGPVRSGKNFVENVRFLTYLLKEPWDDPKSSIAFCGASTAAIEEIFLNDLLDMVGHKNWTYDKGKGRGTIYGRKFQCFPCQKAGDFKRLRGRTIGGALITEGTLCDKDFFFEMLARLTHSDAKLFIDTNPGSPFHWLYTDFITNEKLIAEGKVAQFAFTFDSNPSLSEEYKDSLKEFYVPGSLWYQRMIEGLWVMADGVIYQSFTKDQNTIDPKLIPTRFDQVLNMGLDYGTSNPFAGLIGGKRDGVWYITKEYYYDGREKGQKTDQQYADALAEFITDPLKYLYLDPSAASFKAELKKHQGFRNTGARVKDADNSVLEGIAALNSLIGNGQLKISSDCANAIREAGAYCWDPNAQKRGEDKPKKENDHAMDAMRYLIYSQTNRKTTGGKNWSK